MKRKLLDYLICLECKKNKNQLQLYVFDEKKASQKTSKEVKDGLLLCPCGRWYPIINFIPRMTIVNMRDDQKDFVRKYKKKIKNLLKYPYSFKHEMRGYKQSKTQKQVKNSYDYKWKILPSNIYDKNMTRFYDEWFMKKLGISNKIKFNNYFKNMRCVLDAGTGVGTKIETIVKRSKAEVIGVDLSGVEYAFKNTKLYQNAHVVQADIFNLPFRKGSFDFIVSDGVIHHTSDAEKAFYCLVPLLQKGGTISIHVYKKMGVIREFTDDYLRDIATKLSSEDCYKFCKPFTTLGKVLNEANLKIKIPFDINCLQIKKGTYDLQRFIYYTFFQCFWNPMIGFKKNNIINYDWFHPVNASRHTEEEVLSWFRKSRFKKVCSYRTNPSGISMVGIK